jgi:hypothetical protein
MEQSRAASGVRSNEEFGNSSHEKNQKTLFKTRTKPFLLSKRAPLSPRLRRLLPKRQRHASATKATKAAAASKKQRAVERKVFLM